nr:MAG TPA: Microtubule-associated protein 1A/1B, light chain, lipidation, ubiquitin-like, Trypanosoma brucei.3A [Caudoviricetes sp.]
MSFFWYCRVIFPPSPNLISILYKCYRSILNITSF